MTVSTNHREVIRPRRHELFYTFFCIACLELADCAEAKGGQYAGDLLPERSVTVFSSDLPTWAHFLAQRYELPTQPAFDGWMEITAPTRLQWHGHSPMAQPWSRWTEIFAQELLRRCEGHDLPRRLLEAICWRGGSPGQRSVRVVSELRLPGLMVRWNRQHDPHHAVILVHPVIY